MVDLEVASGGTSTSGGGGRSTVLFPYSHPISTHSSQIPVVGVVQLSDSSDWWTGRTRWT